jgi:pimeloyl-ACP methyl ester carboxylesterase
MNVAINGIDLHYEDTGARDGLPVVFIHAFPMHRAMWTEQARAIADRCRVVTYDVRGFGGSVDPVSQHTLEMFVEDLLGLLDHLSIPRAVLCGLSMGGYIALRTVERAPDRVAGLVLCDTRSEPDSNEARLKRGEAIKAIRRVGLPAYVAKFVLQAFAPSTFEGNPALVAQARSWMESNAPTGVCGALLAMAARTDTTAVLSMIRVPTLILVGDQDTLTPPSAAEAMRARIPNAVCHVIPNAGHMSNLENPAAFNARLREFLDGM